MAQTETIREFLVSLGFKTDEPTLKKFTTTIEGATKAVIGLALAIETTAIAVAAGVARFASNLEALYFASQRTGAAAINLQAIDRAAQNFGASAGEALASVEGLAHALRINPAGTEGLLAAWGVQLKDAKGNARDLTDVMLDLAKVFQGMQIQMAEQYAGTFGISEQTMLAMRNGDFSNEVRRLRQELSAADWDKATRDAHAFEIQLRDLKTNLEALGVTVVDALQQKLGFSLKDLNQWIKDHKEEIAAWMINTAIAIGHAADDIVIAITAITHAYDGLLRKATAVWDFFEAHGPRKLVDIFKDSANETRHDLGLISEDEYRRNRDYFDRTYGLGDNNPGNLEFAGQPGATRATGGRFAHFSDAGQGLAALARQLELYASRGTTSVQGIVSKYAPANENDTAGYIANVAKALGVQSNAALDLNNPSTLANLMSAIVRQEGNSAQVTAEAIQRAAQNALQPNRPQGIADTAFGRWLTALADKADAAAVRNGVTVGPQTTTIHVTGSGDPSTTARAVADEQSRVHQELLRNVSIPYSF